MYAVQPSVFVICRLNAECRKVGKTGTCERIHSAQSVVPLFRGLARPFERGMPEGREEVEPARGSTPLSRSFRSSGFSLGRLNAECRKVGKRWNLREDPLRSVGRSA